MCLGAGDFTHPETGRTYRGGVVAEMAAVSNNTDLSPNEMSITVSGVQIELATLTRYDDYQYAEVRVWMFGLNQRRNTLPGGRFKSVVATSTNKRSIKSSS